MEWISLGSTTRRLAVLLGCGIVAGFLVVRAVPRAAGEPQPPKVGDPSQPLYDLGFKFQSSGGCVGGQCHSSVNHVRGKKNPYVNDAYTLWNKAGTQDEPPDPHRTSFATLNRTEAKEIARRMGMASSKVRECYACHAINPPDALLEGGKLLAEGVTCNGCHGPSGPKVPVVPGDKGWAGLHLAANWENLKQTTPHAALLKKTGFYNTSPLIERAERCASCHLAIDPKMVAAGHPQPTFELYWFTFNYNNRHWDNPTDKYVPARLWAAGQVVALREGLQQLESRAKNAASTDADIRDAYNEAFAHYAVFAPLAAQIKADVKDLNGALTSASRSLVGADTRAALAAAARSGADSTEKLFPAVRDWAPDKDSDLAVLKAVMGKAAGAEATGVYGMEQSRDAIFALYTAYAAANNAQANLNLIEANLFNDADGKRVRARQLTAEYYRKGLAAVKDKLQM